MGNSKIITLLALLIMLSTLQLSAQLFVTLEPTFFRPGLLYNKQFKTVGAYTHAWYGNIQGVHGDGGVFYTDNIKLGIGLSLKTDGLCPMLGINRNWFFNINEDDRIIQTGLIKKYSVEVGVMLRHRRFTGLMMTDPFNWESIIGVSYNFGDKRCPAYKRKHKHK